MHSHSFVSDGKNLTPLELVRTARAGTDPAQAPGISVEMSAAAKARVLASRSIVDAIVARGDLVYGITTGFEPRGVTLTRHLILHWRPPPPSKRCAVIHAIPLGTSSSAGAKAIGSRSRSKSLRPACRTISPSRHGTSR